MEDDLKELVASIRRLALLIKEQNDTTSDTLELVQKLQLRLSCLEQKVYDDEAPPTQ